MTDLIRRIEWSPEEGSRMLAATGKPDFSTRRGIRRLFLQRPVWIIARRWVVGTGPVPTRHGRVRTRIRHGEREIVSRPRIVRIPSGHPWRHRLP